MAKVMLVNGEIHNPEMASLARQLMIAHFVLFAFAAVSFVLNVIIYVIFFEVDPNPQNLIVSCLGMLFVALLVFFVKTTIEQNNTSFLQIICVLEGVCSACVLLNVCWMLLAVAAFFALELPSFGFVLLVIAVLYCLELSLCLWGTFTAHSSIVKLQQGDVFTGLPAVRVQVATIVGQPLGQPAAAWAQPAQPVAVAQPGQAAVAA